MPKTVMILGCSRYYVNTIQAVKDMGCRVLVTDVNPDAHGKHFADFFEPIDIADMANSLAIARKYRIDAVLPINDMGIRTASYVAKNLGLSFFEPNVASAVTSKRAMRECWAKEEVPSARFIVVHDLTEAKMAVDELDCWPLILKPADSRGGGSRGVSRIESSDELESALRFAQSFYDDKTVLIEEFLEGSEHTVEALVHEGLVNVLAVSDRYKMSKRYMPDKTIAYPSELDDEQIRRVKQATEQAVTAMGVRNGPVHVEMAFTDDGPRLFELNARLGGGGIAEPIVPYVSGVRIVQEAVRIGLGDPPNDLRGKGKGACVYRFLNPPPGMVKSIAGLNEVKKWKGILDCAVTFREGEMIRPVRTGGDRAGFVIAVGDSRQEAMGLADRAEAHIKFFTQSESEGTPR